MTVKSIGGIFAVYSPGTADSNGSLCTSHASQSDLVVLLEVLAFIQDARGFGVAPLTATGPSS